MILLRIESNSIGISYLVDYIRIDNLSTFSCDVPILFWFITIIMTYNNFHGDSQEKIDIFSDKRFKKRIQKNLTI